MNGDALGMYAAGWVTRLASGIGCACHSSVHRLLPPWHRNQPHPAAWSSLVGPHSPAMSGSPDGDKENLMFGRPNLLGSQDLTVLANKLLQGQLDTAANARVRK